MLSEPLDYNRDMNRSFTRKPDFAGQSYEKEKQFKNNQVIEEKILNNVFKINLLVFAICIFLIIFYFVSDETIIFMDSKSKKSTESLL